MKPDPNASSKEQSDRNRGSERERERDRQAERQETDKERDENKGIRKKKQVVFFPRNTYSKTLSMYSIRGRYDASARSPPLGERGACCSRQNSLLQSDEHKWLGTREPYLSMYLKIHAQHTHTKKKRTPTCATHSVLHTLAPSCCEKMLRKKITHTRSRTIYTHAPYRASWPSRCA